MLGWRAAPRRWLTRSALGSGIFRLRLAVAGACVGRGGGGVCRGVSFPGLRFRPAILQPPRPGPHTQLGGDQSPFHWAGGPHSNSRSVLASGGCPSAALTPKLVPGW